MSLTFTKTNFNDFLDILDKINIFWLYLKYFVHIMIPFLFFLNLFQNLVNAQLFQNFTVFFK